ncbi:hypothetical protein [Paraburkholderia youngii]|uniref:hypothetical protein n=1 Tax=Paraburkholderia youngii TaxID=2782701 RepID=UPI00159057D8|nr:hypothetical protein [Paraburkholderia youngii]NUX58716.1 hypothetical protein [Paraburkholderia youngii]
MIKARAGDTVIFGLSRTNIERLQEGKPIVFDGAQVGLDGNRVVIMFGETEASIMAQLNNATGERKSH